LFLNTLIPTKIPNIAKAPQPKFAIKLLSSSTFGVGGVSTIDSKGGGGGVSTIVSKVGGGGGGGVALDSFLANFFFYLPSVILLTFSS